MEYKTGIVFDIDHFAVHDGPGIRTSVFLKGCPLFCRWCHSPESQRPDPELLFAPSRCGDCLLCTAVCPLGLHQEDAGRHIFTDRQRCALCGRCAAICPAGAVFVSGREMSSREVADEALEDAAFYRNSGGGVTLSGGEVLYQPAFAQEILRFVKQEGVHTIVETAGEGGQRELLAMAPYVDVFYYDMKLADPVALLQYTGGDLAGILGNLEALRLVTDGIVLRVPLIPSVTDTPENVGAIVEIARRLEIDTVHLLPYNRSAAAKYEWCGTQFPMEEPPPDTAPAANLLQLGGCGMPGAGKVRLEIVE